MKTSTSDLYLQNLIGRRSYSPTNAASSRLRKSQTSYEPVFCKPLRLGIIRRLFVCLAALASTTFAVDGRAELASNSLLKAPNLNPFAVLAYTPSTESAHLVSAKTFEVALSHNIANNFVINTAENEVLRLDGESSTSDFILRYGLRQNVELSIALSHVDHSGGRLDRFISRWHKAFGLPNADREYVDDNEISYSWAVDSEDRASVQSSVSGIGDTVIGVGFNLHSSPGQRITLRSALSLPTGDAEVLLGSGTKALSTFLTASKSMHFLPYSSVLRWGVGATLSHRSTKVDVRRRRAAASAYAGLMFKVAEKIRLKTRLEYSQGRYKSSIPELSQAHTRMVFGGTIVLKTNRVIDFAIAEDLTVGHSPDVSFHARLAASF